MKWKHSPKGRTLVETMHVIIGHPDSKGRDRYISLREEGLCKFS